MADQTQKALEQIHNDLASHKQEDTNNFANLNRAIQYNNNLTEGIVQKMSGLQSDLNLFSEFKGELKSDIGSIKIYMKNLDDRIVEERKEREKIKEDFSFYKGGMKFAAALWGTVSSIIVGVAIWLITKHS